MLYISYLWLIYFKTESLYLLISITYFFPFLTPFSVACMLSRSVVSDSL